MNHLLPPASQEPFRVLLYTLITAQDQFRLIERDFMGRVRNRARRAFELARWRFSQVWRGHYSDFEDTLHNNRGDISIRVAVRDQLLSLLSGRPEIVEVAWGGLGRALRGHEGAWDL